MAQTTAAKKQTAKKQVSGKRASKTPAGARAAAKRAAAKRTPAKRAAAKVAKAAPPLRGARLPSLFYRLNTLLHTVRLIGSYEDQLCTLLHEMKTRGTATPELSHDLRALLDEMPSSEYREELDTVRDRLLPPPVSGKAVRGRRLSR